MVKYHIITYGCQMNESDSERIATQLEKQKHQLAKNIKQADLIVINVCSVRQSAINRVYDKIKKIRLFSKKPKIILTGCILEKDKKQFKEKVDKIKPISDNFKIKTNCQSTKQALVPIMTGCNNFCSYCAVPYTRGREKSRPTQEIIKEVKNLIKNNYKEITLLGQNVNSYQNNFPKLLKTLNHLPGNFEINFMTSHPKDMSDELISIIASSKKVSKNIHLPVQSGDNKILKKMNRGYTVQDYKKLIKKIRQQIPKAKISTDIIVGFPDETEKQFQNTVKLVKEIRFSQAYVSAYSPRPGTVAHKFKDNIPSGIKKRRKKILLDMF
ncbi:MAG: MiaB/RimO family radical SAM methylthiotransferase [Patescibacteria group bacterium]